MRVEPIKTLGEINVNEQGLPESEFGKNVPWTYTQPIANFPTEQVSGLSEI